MKTTTHKIYWTDIESGLEQCFVAADLDQMLEFTKALRSKGTAHYIATASEYGEEIVGKQGVDVTDASYDWKKRRA